MVRSFRFAFLLLALPIAACDCSSSSCATTDDCEGDLVCMEGECVARACLRNTDCSGTDRCIDNLCVPTGENDAGTDASEDATPDVDRPDSPPGPECLRDEMCEEGVCIDNACCASEDACGEQCCGDGSVCFANACVSPGAACVKASDCAEGEYCEPSLGEEPPPPTDMCLSPPPTGRCLALPPTCEEGAPAEDCIRECQVVPDDFGPLNAVEQWRWGVGADEYPEEIDVWSTPVVGRVTDTNCDGEIDLLDPPNLVFVSGDTQRVVYDEENYVGTCCHCGRERDSGELVRDGCRRGVLRVLDGRTGTELHSIRGSSDDLPGFVGVTPALGDVDDDGSMEIVALDYDGFITIIDGDGSVLARADRAIEEFTSGAACTTDTDCGNNDCVNNVCVNRAMGWGGGLALGDIDGDGAVEVNYGRQVFGISADGSEVTHRWTGTAGTGGVVYVRMNYFVDVVPDSEGLELIAGNTVYSATGEAIWTNAAVPNAFTGVADFNNDGAPEIAYVRARALTIVDAATGDVLAGPTQATGSGSGGPPTIADFDGDGAPEVGIALRDNYVLFDVDLDTGTLTQAWATPTHDLSSSQTGSTVFDFEGDGRAEVVYNDECFLWVYDGTNGSVRFAAPTTSFTGTEASLVADVDGDGKAEMVMIGAGSDPRAPQGWDCDAAPWNEPGEDGVRPGWAPPEGELTWRGIVVFRDAANSWVGTRPVWNQHSYSVTNVCDPGDDACVPEMGHGAIPAAQRDNWSVPWLNNFRQNVQADGLFDAPDPAIVLGTDCSVVPARLVATMRNAGQAILAEGVEVIFRDEDGTEIGRATSTTPLFPGQATELSMEAPPAGSAVRADIVTGEDAPFVECFDDNNSAVSTIDACGPV